MEDISPTPGDKPRVGLSKGAGSPPAERIAAVVAREGGAAKIAEAKPGIASRATLEERMTSLATALRKARIENAEHAAAVADIRSAEIGRLEILAEAMAPVVAEIPEDVDTFDLAISPGERPRLFIDQIGYVEMDRDRRTYRFVQDTRHGRVTLCESDKVDTLVDAATTYIAHRLIEREKALASDYASGGAAQALKAKIAAARREEAARGASIPGGLSSRLFSAFLFIAEFLGSAAFFGLVIVLGLWIYRNYIAQ